MVGAAELEMLCLPAKSKVDSSLHGLSLCPISDTKERKKCYNQIERYWDEKNLKQNQFWRWCWFFCCCVVDEKLWYVNCINKNYTIIKITMLSHIFYKNKNTRTFNNIKTHFSSKIFVLGLYVGRYIVWIW